MATHDPVSDLTPRVDGERLFRNLKKYMADGKKDDILYGYQKNIMQDTAKFLEAGGKRGYIEAPTGTGKTVLFVTLAEAFGYQDATPPKILVVTPTKDLVRQTQGGTRGDKGFAGFAPDLTVGTFYSDTPAGMRSLDAQVTITTYASLAKLAATAITTTDGDGKRHTRIVNQVNERFDVIFLDEGHKALGISSRRIIQAIHDNTLIIGFSATPDYTATRSLANLLPDLIHRLDLKEAIMLDMLSPVTPIALPAPASAKNEFTVGAMGEYENRSLKQLIHNTTRNQMVVDVARRVIQAGNTPIIACIPGDTMLHPHIVADLLSATYVTDADGNQRAVRAIAVTGAMPAAMRQQYYAQLENGEIDALTYIDVLTEGWDSQRANVIINARPTRSLVSARQRMGRILRVKPDGRPAIAIDIADQVSSATAPQVSMADIFTLDQVVGGQLIGNTTLQQQAHTTAVIDELVTQYGAINPIKNLYTQYALLLETIPQLSRGQAQIKQDGTVRTFASADRLSKRFGIDSFMLEHLKQGTIETRKVRSRHEAVDAYNEDDVHEQIATLPDAARRGHGLVVDEQKYVTLGELHGILQHKYELLQPTYDDMLGAIAQSSDAVDTLYFTKRFRARTHRGVALYTAQTMIEFGAAQGVVAHFKQST